jgi:hypothetical protein
MTYLVHQHCYSSQHWANGQDDQRQLPSVDKSDSEPSEESGYPLHKRSHLVPDTLVYFVDVTK